MTCCVCRLGWTEGVHEDGYGGRSTLTFLSAVVGTSVVAIFLIGDIVFFIEAVEDIVWPCCESDEVWYWVECVEVTVVE